MVGVQRQITGLRESNRLDGRALWKVPLRVMLFVVGVVVLLAPLAPRDALAQPRRHRAPSPLAGSQAPSTSSVPPAGVELARVCMPGAQMACACLGGAGGVQTCNGLGTALEPCACPSPLPPPAAPLAVEARATPLSAMVSTSRWYGWQVLLADVVGGTLAGIGTAADVRALLIVGGVIQIAGPPTVHWAHGRVGAGFGSVGLRIGGPLLGGLAAAGIQTASGFGIDWIGVGIGASAGALVALVVDVAALSHERVARPQTASTAVMHRAQAFITPGLSVGPSGATVTLDGAF